MAEAGEGNGVVLVDLGPAPDEVIVLILKRVPAKELVKACTQVSKQWHRILSQKFFWKEKLEELDGYRLPWQRVAAGQPVRFYQMMAIKQPFLRNYIRDSREPILACLVTDHNCFVKRITVRLADEGLTDELMDSFRPTIVVSELVANRLNYPTEYRMHCYLSRDDQHNPRICAHSDPVRIEIDMSEEANGQWVGAFRRKHFQPGEAECWHLVRHEFKQYPAGMRRLVLICSGTDRQDWAGFYGFKMARSSVMALCEGNNALEAEEGEAVHRE